MPCDATASDAFAAAPPATAADRVHPIDPRTLPTEDITAASALARKVLVIDDAPDLRARLRGLLASWGFEPILAANGEAGLAHLNAGDIALVICDWMMDGLSGPEVCAAIRARDYGHYVYCLLLTGRTGNTDLVQGLTAGADDFIAKPFDAQVLRARLQVGVRLVGLEACLAERNQRLRVQRDALERANRQMQADLAAAARVQRELLPTSDAAIAPWRAGWLFRPVATVSGDSFGFFALPQRRIGFYHIDVSGHGIPAALLSVSLGRALLPGDGEAAAEFDPVALIEGLNADLCRRDEEVNHYATMAVGVIERASGAGQLVVAGHPHPLLVRAHGAITPLTEGGLPVGMFAHAEVRAQTFSLAAGERLLLYSDGILDCPDPAGTAFGPERLRQFLHTHRACAVDDLAAALGAHLGDWHAKAPFDDDISLLLIERPRTDAAVAAKADPAIAAATHRPLHPAPLSPPVRATPTGPPDLD